MDAMADSAGALDEAYSVYMDSTTAHLNQFKAAFQELGSVTLETESLNRFIDAGTTLLGLLTGLIDTVGTLPTLVMAASAAMSFKNIGRDKMFFLNNSRNCR